MRLYFVMESFFFFSLCEHLNLTFEMLVLHRVVGFMPRATVLFYKNRPSA